MDHQATSPQCLNCGFSFRNEESFCPGCGQKSKTHRLSFHEIGHDTIHYFTHADKGVFYLLKRLVFQPGIVAREYIEGKRKKYFKPLNFFLIVVGIVVFMTSTLHTVDDNRSRNIEQAAERVDDPEMKKQMIEMAGRLRMVGKVTSKYTNIINMVATPLLTILFWLAYLRGRYNYVEHLVANMYFVGFIMLFYALAIVPMLYFSSTRVDFLWLGIFFLFEIVYRGHAYYKFIGKEGIGPAIKAYGISALCSIVWIALTMSLIYFYIQTGFK
jgi:Protein of unknown function (DUF3667)